MRINKYIASCGVCSRRGAEDYIKQGLVKVNDKIVTNLATDINVGIDKVTISNQVIKPVEDKVYYMLNKPKGYISSLSDDRNRKSIIDLLNTDKRVFPIGRLDYESEGLLLLTNDGELAYKLTHPKFAIEKKYIVKVNGQMKESELAVLRAGVVIDGIRYSKCRVKVLEYKENLSRIEVVLTEGKNREIRKMFSAINKEVIFLKRTEIAGIRLGGLSRGEIRPLNEQEIRYLKSL